MILLIQTRIIINNEERFFNLRLKFLLELSAMLCNSLSNNVIWALVKAVVSRWELPHAIDLDLKTNFSSGSLVNPPGKTHANPLFCNKNLTHFESEENECDEVKNVPFKKLPLIIFVLSHFCWEEFLFHWIFDLQQLLNLIHFSSPTNSQMILLLSLDSSTEASITHRFSASPRNTNVHQLSINYVDISSAYLNLSSKGSKNGEQKGCLFLKLLL